MFASTRRGSPAAAVLVLALALGCAMWACAPASPPAPAGPAPVPAEPSAPESVRPATPEGPDPCVVRSGAPLAPDTVRVIAGGVFAPRQLYQTLIRLDCTGIPRPDLAQSWTSSDGGRTWGFRLGAGRFWDNAPVTGDSIAEGWAQDSIASKLLRTAGILSVTAGSEGDLRILLARAQDSVPLILADQRLAVVRRNADSAWPVGTGPYRLPETDPAPATLEPVGAGAPIRLLRPPADLRDAVDAGADLIVTDDPGAVGYASGRPEFTVLALPWSRTYALVLPTPPASVASLETTAFRESLARDAVRVDARAAPASISEEAQPPCEPPSSSGTAPRPSPTSGRIAYPSADPIARDLAARLAALGVGGTRSIVPMDPSTLQMSLRKGAEAAYVLARPRTMLACTDLALPAGARVLPLVETRAHALLRRGAPTITADWDGTPRLLPESR